MWIEAARRPLSIGYPLGAVKVNGVGLGSTAGVLVVGIAISFTMGFEPFDIRAYTLDHDELVGKSVEDLYKQYHKAPILRVVRDGTVIEASENPTLQKGDVLAIAAEAAKLIAGAEQTVGPEVDEPPARNIEKVFRPHSAPWPALCSPGSLSATCAPRT